MKMPLRLAIVVLLGVVAFGGWAVAATGDIDLSLSVSPNPACSGSPVVVTGSVTNNGELTDQVSLGFTVEGRNLAARTKLRVPAGKTLQIVRTILIPPSFPPGAYTITVNATSAHGGADSETVTVEVRGCR